MFKNILCIIFLACLFVTSAFAAEYEDLLYEPEILIYKDWEFSDDFSDVTIKIGESYETYENDIVMYLDGDQVKWFNMGGRYLTSPYMQREHPHNFFSDSINGYTRSLIKSIASNYPQQKLLLINGERWYETEYEGLYLTPIADVYKENREDMYKKDYKVYGYEFHLYKNYQDFLRAGNTDDVGRIAYNDSLEVYIGRLLSLGKVWEGSIGIGEKDTDIEYIERDEVDDLPEKVTTTKNVELNLKIGNKHLRHKLNGVASEKVLDAAPVMRNSRTFVPIRFVAENLGARVNWNGDTHEVTIGLTHQTQLSVRLDSREAYIGNKKFMLDAPVFLSEEYRTMVPLRFVSEAMGYHVAWNGKTKEIVIVGDVEVINKGADASLPKEDVSSPNEPKYAGLEVVDGQKEGSLTINIYINEFLEEQINEAYDILLLRYEESNVKEILSWVDDKDSVEKALNKQTRIGLTENAAMYSASGSNKISLKLWLTSN